MAGAPLLVAVVGVAADGAVENAYGGPQCVTFSGPSTTPDGTAPGYPAEGSCATGSGVSFVGGVAVVSVDLVEPETTALKVADAASELSGTSKDIVVTGPGGPSTTAAPVGPPAPDGSSSSSSTTAGGASAAAPTGPVEATTTAVTTTSVPTATPAA
jgi:hypothetical protein